MFKSFFYFVSAKKVCVKIQSDAFVVNSLFNYVNKYLAKNTNFKQFKYYILIIVYILSFYYNIYIFENCISKA